MVLHCGKMKCHLLQSLADLRFIYLPTKLCQCQVVIVYHVLCLFLENPALGLLWLYKYLIYTAFKNIIALKHLKTWSLLKEEEIKINLFNTIFWALYYWISLNGHYWYYLLPFYEYTTVLSAAPLMRCKSRGVSLLFRNLSVLNFRQNVQ